MTKISSGLQVHGKFPLLKASRLDPVRYGKLRNAVNLYLLSCLEAFYIDRKFHLGNNLLDDYMDEILGLPNITPNGLILPKQRTYLAYNLVHAAVAEILTSLDLETHIKSIHAPVNIRLVDGTPNPCNDSRPRATTKLHSDMWAGEPANAVMVFLPVLGEFGRIGIKWIEPRSFPVSLMRPLDDFDEGKRLADDGIEYDTRFNAGDIVLADPFLLHATQKNTHGLRLSLDLRFLTAQNLESDRPAPGTRHRNYMSFPEWSDIGHGRILVSDTPLVPFTNLNDSTKNAYAAVFKIVKIDDCYS